MKIIPRDVTFSILVRTYPIGEFEVFRLRALG